MAQISRADLQSAGVSEKAEIRHLQHLSSYNWIEAPTPTIVVPGAPARWEPLAGAQQIPKDSGFVYIAQNAGRHPDSPLEALFRSLYIENDTFDIGSIDLITERNSIHKLLSFASGRTTGRKEHKEVTIAVEVVQNTAIYCREETATHTFIGPDSFHGHGREFEKEYTTCQVPGTGHHRVISYDFCGLGVIVCHETDGYLDDDSAPPAPSQSRMTEFSDIKSSKLSFARGGQVVPVHCTLEIKTCAARRSICFRDVAAQLWASQTPNLVRAYHTWGTFQEPYVEDVAAHVRQWEADNQPNLQRLAWLIRRITALVRECGGKAKVRYDADGDRLMITRDDGKKLLPEDLYAKWNVDAAGSDFSLSVTMEGAGDAVKQTEETVAGGKIISAKKQATVSGFSI